MFGLSSWKGRASSGTGSGASPNERDPTRDGLAAQLQQIEWLASAFFVTVLLAVALYSVAEFWRRSCSFDVLFFNLGTLFGLAVTAAVIGGLLGFLFGIPRSMQGNSAASAPASPPGGAAAASDDSARTKPIGATGRAFAGNSNLEEISDWLTKIIVGVGLVQAGTIYTKLFSLATWFKAADPQSQGADVMFILVLLSALIGGFLFLYLETRTRVMQLFVDVEAVIAPKALEEPAIRTALQAPIGTGRGQMAAPSSTEDEKLLEIPYEALKTGDQLAAWASAQARAGNLQAANQALRAAVAKEPGNKDYLVRLADVLERQGSHEAAGALIVEAQQKQGDDLALLKRDLVQALYQQPPQSFEKALPLAQQLMARPDGARDPFVHVWNAAAEGQRYLWLSQNKGSEADKQVARKRALDSAKRVVELAPDPKSSARALLRGMLDPSRPGAAPDDNDLEVFKDDEEFKAVIDPGA